MVGEVATVVELLVITHQVSVNAAVVVAAKLRFSARACKTGEWTIV